MNLQRYVYYLETARMYPVESLTKNAVTIIDPDTNQLMHINPAQCEFYYSKEQVDAQIAAEQSQNKSLKVSHLFMAWYRAIEYSIEVNYLDSEAECTNEERVIEETTYKVIRYISEITASKPIKEYTHHMTTDEIKALSSEINTNKQAYLKAVLDRNFIKQERWIIGVKENVANIIIGNTNERFLRVFGKDTPSFKIEKKATALNKVQLDEWLAYFKKNEIPVDVKFL